MKHMERARLEHEAWNNLHHVTQLLMGRNPNDVAWWLRENHAAYLSEQPEHVQRRINEMATEAETTR